jgi:hypothetical protein
MVMQAILKSYLDEGQVLQLMQHLGIRKRESCIFFLTQWMLALRRYPDSIFANEEVRLQFLHVLQDMLDGFILEEENHALC